MNILVTGGAGFIGSHLAEELLRRGHQVFILDDLSTGNRLYIEELKIYPKLRFVEGSILNRILVKEIMKDSEVVFHLAAVLGVKNTVENPLKVIEGNIDGTKIILEEAFHKKVKVIFASTSEVYGKNDQLPFHEDSNRVLGPTTKHRWCYATAKALDEHLCFAYGEKGLPVTVVRYFNAYGPRAMDTQYGGVIPKFIVAALQNKPITVYGTGEQTRCFTYVSDSVEGTIQCMGPRHNDQVYNIGTNEQLSINELAKKIKYMSGSTSPIVHISYNEAYGNGYEDSPDRVPDLNKSMSLLQYKPSIGFNEGLQKTISWYRKKWSQQG
jgi:UDP-glucose 4-epimerase